MTTFMEEDIKRVMADIFGVDVQTVNENSSIDTLPDWDSLRHLNLILALEEKFQISFSEEETIEILNYKLIKIALEKHGVKFGP